MGLGAAWSIVTCGVAASLLTPKIYNQVAFSAGRGPGRQADLSTTTYEKWRRGWAYRRTFSTSGSRRRPVQALWAWAPAVSVAKIFLEPVDLVHALMQNRDDTDIAVGQSAPINEVVLVPEEEPFDAELCRDGL